MKKIGVLFGKERSFPEAFIARVNSKNVEGIMAEPVRIDKVMQVNCSVKSRQTALAFACADGLGEQRIHLPHVERIAAGKSRWDMHEPLRNWQLA